MSEASRPSPKNKSARLLELVEQQSPMLFHTETGEPFARVKVQGHFENLPIYGPDFSCWIKRLAWEAAKEVVNSEALDGARGVLEARARFDGGEHRLYNRVAWHNGAIWYDLTDSHWHAVKVTCEDWELEVNPPILFRRYSHHRPQSVPDRAGTLSELEAFLNLKVDVDPEGHATYDERYLFVVALLSFLVPEIPHPVIVLHGEHGSAKTTLSRIARELIDPSATLTLGEPKRDEIGQLLQHHYLLPLDNLSSMPSWLSDTLCRAVTGEGLSKRRLYTDEGDVIFAYRRCILLNGINSVVGRPDLLSRSVSMECQPIPDHRRKAERIFWQEFESAKRRILGGMFNALSRAMKLKSTLRAPELERMADFAEWGCAIAEASGWGQTAFREAYAKEATSRDLVALDSSPVAQALIAFTANHQYWSGTAKELLASLSMTASNDGIDIRATGWPRQPHVLSRRINEVRPNLRRLGVQIAHGWHGSDKIITITLLDSAENREGSEGSEGFDGNEGT